MLQNLRSMRITPSATQHNFTKVKDLIAAESLSMLFLCETHLRNVDDSCLYDITDYAFHRQDRGNYLEKGGGLACYIHSSFASRVLPDLCVNCIDYEAMAIQVSDSGHEMCIFLLVYQTNHFSPTVRDRCTIRGRIICSLEAALLLTPHVCLLGDFNLPDDGERRSFISDVNITGLSHYDTEATHVLGNKLDLVFAPHEFFTANSVVAAETILMSDHKTLIARTEFFNKNGGLTRVKRRVLLDSELDLRQFERVYRELIYQVHSQENYDGKWAAFIHVLNTCCLQTCAVKTIDSHRKPKLPVSTAMRDSKKERNRLCQMLRYLPSDQCPRAARERLKVVSKNITKELKFVKQRETEQLCQAYDDNNQAAFWSKFRQITGGNNKASKIQQSIATDNGIITGAAAVSNHIKNSFQANFAINNNNVPPCSPVSVISNVTVDYSQRNLQRIIKNAKSAGAQFFINTAVLKRLFPVVGRDLSKLFSLGLTNSQFPKIGKTSLIVPVPKCGNEFRPIALTSPLLGRLFEQPIYDALLEHAKKGKIFPTTVNLPNG